MTLFTGGIAPKPPRMGQLGPEPKEMLSFVLGKVENNKYREDETWHPERRWMTLL